MDYLVLIVLLSLGVIIFAIVVFKYLWLSRGIYIMPPSISFPHRHNLTQSPNLEYSVTKFLLKMMLYILWKNKSILVKEIGFEQAYYLVFYRIMITFFLFSSIIATTIVTVWSSTKSPDKNILYLRLIGSKDTAITSNDFHTFVQCLYTVAMTWVIIHYRSRMNAHNIRLIKQSEDKPGRDREEEWLQIRTVKVRGVLPQDTKGICLKGVLQQLMLINNIPGKILYVTVIPDLQKAIRTQDEIRFLQSNFRIDKYKDMHSPCRRWLFTLCRRKETYLADVYLDKLESLNNQLREEVMNFKNSGHAFLLLDSPISAGRLAKLFR